MLLSDWLYFSNFHFEYSPFHISQKSKMSQAFSYKGFVEKGDLSIPELPSRIRSFVHEGSQMRLVLGITPGPLSQMTIVVATVPENDQGLPHTLEHLVFCGSKSFPERGYLDKLATRCLAEGTNAWTSDEYTAYTVTTAGSEGMMNILPVFLDHVLHPLLLDEHFLTEVYHVSKDGQEMGVVYSEMAARENTENDLMDIAFRRLLFERSTYVNDAGGATKDIAQLTMADIRAYHSKYYRTENMTIILTGQSTPQQVIDALHMDYLPEIYTLDSKHSLDRTSAINSMADLFNDIPAFTSDKSSNIYFPSDEEDIGTIVYGWRGPPLVDYRTNVALDIIARYLVETEASLLIRQFVEIPAPIANDVDFDAKSFPQTAIQLMFTGVPLVVSAQDQTKTSVCNGTDHHHTQSLLGCCSEEDHEDDDVEGTEEDSEEDSDITNGDTFEDRHDSDQSLENGNEQLAIDHSRLFEPGYLKEHLYVILREIVEKGFPEGIDALLPTIRRLRIKHYLQAWENNPHGFLCEFILPDALIINARPLEERESLYASLGQRTLTVLQYFHEFEKQPFMYWKNLIEKYILSAPCAEIFMIPSKDLAHQNADRQRTRQQELQQRNVFSVIESPQASFGDDTSDLPPIPNAPISRWTCRQFNQLHSSRGSQLIETDTGFSRLYLYMHLKSIKDDVKPFLLLFQEMLFNSPLNILQKDAPTMTLSFNELVAALQQDTLHYSSTLGFRNDVFNCQSLGDLLIISGVCEEKKFSLMCEWVLNVFFFSTFESSRLLAVVQHLLSNLSEMKRDGAEMLDHCATWFCESLLGTSAATNEMYTSPFVQDTLLKGVLKRIKVDSEPVTLLLESIRDGIVSSGDCFYQVCGSRGTTHEFQKLFDRLFEEKRQLYLRSRQTVLSRENMSGPSIHQWVFPGEFRRLFQPPSVVSLRLMDVNGCDSSYLAQYAPCNVMQTEDYFPVLILTELLNRTEGPLYSAVRGGGHAYHVDISLILWQAELVLAIHQASDLPRALEAAHHVIRRVEERPDELLCEQEINTAKASVLYKYYADQSTPALLVREITQWTLAGFPSFEAYEAYALQLHGVQQDDLMRVYHRYFKGMLSRDTPSLYVATTNPLKRVSIQKELHHYLSEQQMGKHSEIFVEVTSFKAMSDNPQVKKLASVS